MFFPGDQAFLSGDQAFFPRRSSVFSRRSSVFPKEIKRFYTGLRSSFFAWTIAERPFRLQKGAAPGKGLLFFW
jgi:hypothetical protein